MLKIAPHHGTKAENGRIGPSMLAAFPNRPTVPSPGGLSTRARARKPANTRAVMLINNTRPGSKNGCRATKLSTNFEVVSKPADNRAQCRPSTFSQAIYSALRGSTSQSQSTDAVECHAPCLFPMDGDGLHSTEWRDSQYRTPMDFDAGID